MPQVSDEARRSGAAESSRERRRGKVGPWWRVAVRVDDADLPVHDGGRGEPGEVPAEKPRGDDERHRCQTEQPVAEQHSPVGGMTWWLATLGISWREGPHQSHDSTSWATVVADSTIAGCVA